MGFVAEASCNEDEEAGSVGRGSEEEASVALFSPLLL
jgi:hypothetical protein